MDTRRRQEIIDFYMRGTPVDELARRHELPWAEVARICGHVWLRPKHIDERGFPVSEDETWQASPTVLGIE